MTKVPFFRPDITDVEISAVSNALREGWLTTGEKARSFEDHFAEKVGSKRALALNSCTSALHLALKVLEVGPGDEVLVPAIGFASSAEVVVHLGAKPVFIDVAKEDHTVDPDVIVSAITPRTRSIIVVDFAGQPAKLNAILDIAHSHNIKVVEDAAHALPAKYHDSFVGSISDITCFSFYSTKTMTTAEGGMATTNSDEWAEGMRLMSLHGISKPAWLREKSKRPWHYDIKTLGWKCNMPDLAAALGLAQLSRLDAMTDQRRAIAKLYLQAFQEQDYFECLLERPECEHAWHLFVMKLRPGVLRIERDQFLQEMNEHGVSTSVHFIPLHMHTYYREKYGYQPEDCPVSLSVYQNSFSLPIYSAMTIEEAERVISVVMEIGQKYRR